MANEKMFKFILFYDTHNKEEEKITHIIIQLLNNS